MRRLALLASLLLASAAIAAEPLARLDFLLGKWTAEGSGDPGKGAGAFSFTQELQGKVLIRRSYADYGPGKRHDDLMVVYADGSALRADFYDSEGHVIRYAVTTPAANKAVFLSDAAPGAPRFRLTYELAAGGRLNGLFEIAPPDKPEAFATYLRWTSVKG